VSVSASVASEGRADFSGLVSTTVLTTASSPSRSDWRLSPDDGDVTSGALDGGALLSGAGDGCDGAEGSGAPDEGAATSGVELSSDKVLPILVFRQELMGFCRVSV
jgi:hypothetical protein